VRNGADSDEYASDPGRADPSGSVDTMNAVGAVAPPTPPPGRVDLRRCVAVGRAVGLTVSLVAELPATISGR